MTDYPDEWVVPLAFHCPEAYDPTCTEPAHRYASYEDYLNHVVREPGTTWEMFRTNHQIRTGLPDFWIMTVAIFMMLMVIVVFGMTARRKP